MVESIGALALWGGLLLAFVGWLFFIVAAFRASILWGLGVLFVPVVWLVFLVLEWQHAKRPAGWFLWGIVLIVLGVFVLSAHVPFIHVHTR
jgi:hypothetical protein